MFKLFDRVRVVTDRYEKIGLPRGAVCAILDQYPTGEFELDYSDPETGATILTWSVHPSEIEPFPRSTA